MTTTILDRRPVPSPEAEPELAGERRLATVTVLRSAPQTRRRAVAAPRRPIPRTPARCPASRRQHVLTDPAPVRLTPRGQAALVLTVLAVTVLALVTVVAAALGRMAGPAGTVDPAAPSRIVVVQPGDTLWDIAAAAAPAADPRSTINVIERLNGLDAADGVRPGLHLVVPAG